MGQITIFQPSAITHAKRERSAREFVLVLSKRDDLQAGIQVLTPPMTQHRMAIQASDLGVANRNELSNSRGRLVLCG